MHLLRNLTSALNKTSSVRFEHVHFTWHPDVFVPQKKRSDLSGVVIFAFSSLIAPLGWTDSFVITRLGCDLFFPLIWAVILGADPRFSCVPPHRQPSAVCQFGPGRGAGRGAETLCSRLLFTFHASKPPFTTGGGSAHPDPPAQRHSVRSQRGCSPPIIPHPSSTRNDYMTESTTTPTAWMAAR